MRSDGAMRWRGELVYISEALAGELVGIAEIGSDRWMVQFANLELGTIERKNPRILRRTPSTDQKSVTHLSGLNCHL